jgi:16S rRNA (cytosine967-C5)-methyltransferase
LSAAGLAAGLNDRRAAAALLGGVLGAGASLADQIADPEGPVARLKPAERARAQSLATTTLRHLGRIDAVLAGLVERAPPLPARNLLRLMAAELVLAGVPAHAAVDSAVRLAQERPKTRAVAGLVNAVGRKLATGAGPLWEAAPEAGLPGWIAAPVEAAWGGDARAAIEAAHLHEPVPVDLTPKGDGADLAARLGAELLPTGSLRLARPGQISRLPGFEAGDWWVQDAAAAVPARMLGAVAGREVLDLCAAPGGKTLQLAAAGARVTALDVSAPRLRRLTENLARTGLSAEVITADALAWSPGRAFAAILLDAPCSATGTIRRHPDLPFVRGADDLPGLTALQAQLLARAWDWLAPGGRLVFCTCSLMPEEGEGQLSRFRALHPEAEVVAPGAGVAGIEAGWIDGAGGLRLRPDFWAERGGMDGFYAMALTKPGIAA